MGKKVFQYLTSPVFYLLSKSSYYGAQTQLYCALEQYDKLVKGGYYSDCKIKPSSLESNDPQIAKRLWMVSEEMVTKAML